MNDVQGAVREIFLYCTATSARETILRAKTLGQRAGHQTNATIEECRNSKLRTFTCLSLNKQPACLSASADARGCRRVALAACIL